MPVIAVLAAYFIGSIPFALITARRWGTSDLRLIGSGNLGAANVWRATGASAGVLVALLDILKGAAGVVVAQRLNSDAAAPAVAGVAAVVGHIYPVWLGFRGGKGVATSCGVFAVLTPLAVLAALGVFALSVWITKYISAGSVMASLALPPLAYAIGSPGSVVAAAAVVAALVLFRHRSKRGCAPARAPGGDGSARAPVVMAASTDGPAGKARRPRISGIFEEGAT
jgi:glycerol-3-phosphate acyltransferase PlsY